MSTEFYLQTRGKAIDYRFLYESPSSDWWRFYAEYILFEDRTIILEQLNDKNGKLYLSGIPSHERRDRVNTVIRYTFVAEFNKGEGSEILPLVNLFLDDCRKNSNTLGDKLDYLFSEQVVEDALRSTDRSEEKNGKCKYVDNTIKNNLDLFNSSDIEDSLRSASKDIYWGGIKYSHSRSQWRFLVKQILEKGEPGVAILLNAVSEKSLPSLKEKLRGEGFDNAFILLPDNNTPPTLIKDMSKSIGALPRSAANILPFQTKIYVGASVLASFLMLLFFMLTR